MVLMKFKHRPGRLGGVFLLFLRGCLKGYLEINLVLG